jgi:TRAP-type C4-dicarboxylate transport system permease small subunit
VNALARVNARVETALGPLVAGLCAALTAVVLWQVATRLLSRVATALDRVAWVEPSRWTEELASFLLAWTALLGAAFALRRGEHIGLDLLYARLDDGARRAADIATRGAVVLFGVTLVIGGLRLTWLTWVLDQRTPALGWPMGAVYAVVPVAGLLLVLFALQRVYVDDAPDTELVKVPGEGA